jgi:hypothetical protein
MEMAAFEYLYNCSSGYTFFSSKFVVALLLAYSLQTRGNKKYPSVFIDTLL